MSAWDDNTLPLTEPRNESTSSPLNQAGEYLRGRMGTFSSENKILLVVILTISLLFFVAAFFIYERYQQTLNNHYQRFGTLMASMVSTGGVDRLTSPLSPELKLQEFIDRLLEMNDDVAAIELYDNSGRLLYENHRPLPPKALQKAIDFTAPLQNQHGETLGEIHVKLTGQAMAEITNATHTIIIIIFLSAWIISITALALNTYLLSKHLRTLVRGVKRLSTGDFGYKISESDLWGELRTLAEAFNDMSVRLRAYEEQNIDTITYERNKLEAVLQSIADGVVVCDDNGEITLMNESACRMLGAKQAGLLIGTNLADYVTVDNERCFHSVLYDYEKFCRSHADDALPKRSLDASPEVFSRQVAMPGLTMKALVSPIFDSDGDNLGFVMTLHDVTKEAQVDKLKTSFISNVSHELRTPVTTIKSYVDTLYNHGGELDEQTYAEFLETLQLETDRLKKLVNDILDFSRLEEADFKLELEEQDIVPVIKLTVQAMKVLAEQKHLVITTALESNLPKVLINSDSIERVMRNLLSNAIKYTQDEGRIRVRAEISSDGKHLEVSVHDTGTGIPEEHLPHIFDRFYRVENAVHTVKGTGIGLHLVKVAIEEHHHGEVFVKSEVGVGSTFGFRLPLAIAGIPAGQGKEKA